MRKILEKQGYHAFLLALLLGGVYLLARGPMLKGSFLGLSTPTWLWTSVMIPVIHQLYVLICWRVELYQQGLSKWLGRRAFQLFGIGFMLLFLARPVAITGLALSNRGSFLLPAAVAWPLCLVFLMLVVYLGYSVLRYFGIHRALGLDHFRPESFRDQEMVTGGIYRWTANPMYLFGFTVLWIPGLYFGSGAALIAALFNHLYVWLHYYFTELPDMRTIYHLD
jgi:protein-S-isoprenylcysteine O-methyltransferase Ste14